MITFTELQTLVRKNKFDFNACALELNSGLISQFDDPESKHTLVTSDKIRLAYAKKESLLGFHLRTLHSKLNEIKIIKAQSNYNINIQKKSVSLAHLKRNIVDKYNKGAKNVSRKVNNLNYVAHEKVIDDSLLDLNNFNDVSNEYMQRRNQAFKKAFDSIKVQSEVCDKRNVDSSIIMSTKICERLKENQNQARKGILKQQYSHDTHIINEQSKLYIITDMSSCSKDSLIYNIL